MLCIKRASAGSGKTYQLAKTYIKLLITEKHPDFRRTLRKDAYFRDALSSILAVTFTVKATAEMKQRIVERLADLSRAHTISDDRIKEVPYLEEFIEDFNTNKYVIASLAEGALRTLLLHYSDFKIQTIDSFFQGILHTFAYEASLDDGFNMEIDTDLVTSVGFDIALNDMADKGAGKEEKTESLIWLRRLMEQEMGGNKWNVFARGEGEKTLYTKLINEARNLDKEDYHKIRERLLDYFDNLERPFSEIVEDVDEANFKPWETLYDECRRAALDLTEELEKGGLEIADIYRGQGKRLSGWTKEFDRNEFMVPDRQPMRGKKATGFSLSAKGLEKLEQNRKKNPAIPSTLLNDIDSAFDAWYEAVGRYVEAYEKGKIAINTWIAFRNLLPSLMMVREIAKRKSEYLTSTNTLQISDTTHILAQIIDGDDTPFVYERMGRKINHYLIDEFQDTSEMQWKNLKPLLDESEARENDNLIIGDAKQSIYRFRNADYTLITGLEKEFHEVRYHTTEKEPKDKSKENTNFRSRPRVVEFNNLVFSQIPAMETIDSDGISHPVFSDTIRKIYMDSVQAVPEKKKEKQGNKGEGYVEITLYYPRKKSEEEKTGESDPSIDGKPGYEELPTRIMELKSRGYSFSDIGILVSSHKQGKAAMKAISLYNDTHPGDEIPVISEENLMVASALSVKLVIRAFEIIAGNPEGRMNKSDILPDPVDEERLFETLRGMQTQSLPAVVETVVEKFVPGERRNEEAPFIAAFQDAVMDYCATRPSDAGSFLKWWKQKSKSLSITSPEDSEGVILQTIHKAKGLEYKCVIIPEANFNFDPGDHSEWRWVTPPSIIDKSELLPPYLPVETNRQLQDTLFSAAREKYCEEVALDELNKMYVGFTRAAEELYAYMPLAKRGKGIKGSDAMVQIFPKEGGPTDERELLKEKVEVMEPDENTLKIIYGHPSTPEQIKREKNEEAEKKGKKGRKVSVVNSYDVSSNRSSLKFQDSSYLRVALHGGDGEEDLDPRAEGTLKHRIMQMIQTPDDLGKAMLRMRVEGLVSPEQAAKWENELRDAIESVADRGWFDPEMKVLNERTILTAKPDLKRPDRILITPENEVIVIDYKFGKPKESYKKQVRNYVDMIASSGSYNKVSGFIWYVEDGGDPIEV